MARRFDENAWNAWAKGSEPMSAAMALSLRELRLIQVMGLLGGADRVSGADRLSPAEALSAASRWALASKSLPGRVAPRPVHEVGGAWIADAWVDSWMQAREDASQESAEWEALAPKLLGVGHELEAALGWAKPLLDAEGLADLAQAGLKRAVDAASVEVKGRELEKTALWMTLAKDAMDSQEWEICLNALFSRIGHKPSSWRAAAALAKAGAKGSPEMWPAARSLLSAAMSEGVAAKSGRVEAVERVACAESILGAMGKTFSSYRGRGGSRFDQIALGALASWPGGEMADALGMAGIFWSSQSRKKAPMVATRMLSEVGTYGEKASRARAGALAMLRVVEGSAGWGPFGPEWISLAKALDQATRHDFGWSAGPKGTSLREEWEQSFAQWGMKSGWGTKAYDALRLHVKSFSKSHALHAAWEAAKLREELQSAEASNRDGAVDLSVAKPARSRSL